MYFTSLNYSLLHLLIYSVLYCRELLITTLYWTTQYFFVRNYSVMHCTEPFSTTRNWTTQYYRTLKCDILFSKLFWNIDLHILWPSPSSAKANTSTYNEWLTLHKILLTYVRICSTVHRYSVLHCNELLSTTLYWSTQYFTVLNYSVLHYTQLLCSLLHFTALHFTSLPQNAAALCTFDLLRHLHRYTSLYCMTPYSTS